MPLAKLAIKQPIFISMVLLAVALLGVLAYSRMGVELYPDMSNPTVSVSVSFPGASPEDVELLITKRIEASVSTASGVDTVSSSSREGSAQVTISFVVGHDLQQGAQEVRERLDTIKRSLPDGAEDPVMRRFDPNTSPFMNAALSISGEDLTPADKRRLVQEIITPRLERISGVAAASVNGLNVQDVMIDLNAAKLSALRVTPQQVVSALQRENVIQPSGRFTTPNANMPLRTTAGFQDLDEIRRLVISRQGSSIILLQDVATVNIRYPEITRFVRVDGTDTMGLSVTKQSGTNVVETARLVKEELKAISRDFPQFKFNIIRDDSTFIQESDHDVTVTLIIGALLAAAIVMLFFRNLRNTIITVAGLPIIVISTFAVISLLGFTRNIISLMALSLSVGLLIDDAIVVRENIFRYMESGASPKEAAEKATGEIAFAVLAISLTIVAIFIPVTFTGGQVGRLLNQFGITVAIAVMISLFEAFTFAPLLTAYFAKPLVMEHQQARQSRLSAKLARAWPAISNGYKNLLVWSLGHRLLVVSGALATFGVSVWLIMSLSFSFFPTTDPSAINIGISLPPGTTLDKTNAIALDVERYAMAQPEVTRVYAEVGGGGSSANSGSVQITLQPGTPTEPVVARFRTGLAQYSRNITFGIPRQFMGVGGGFGGTSVRGRPVVIAVRGPVNIDTLDAAADQVVERLQTVPGLRDTAKSLPAREPELQIVVDRQRAAQMGVSATTVGSTIRTLVSGTTATQVDWQDQRIDVVVSLRKEDIANPSAILDLSIAAPSGDLWPLRTLARLDQGTGPTVLERQDRQGQIMVGANLEGRSQGAVTPDVEKALSDIKLPAGVSWKFGGQQAQTTTAFSGLYFALALGLVFIYMVLASQFGSLIHPVTVMMALPLSAIGALLALVAIHADMTVVSMIGIILLMGLATKNSILLVDFIVRYRREGRDRTEAVITAGPVRLRPIIMTTLAVMLGMIPTALGIGAAGAFRAPMAVAVIGGVFSSTLLSLVVVPVVYTLFDDALVWVTHLFGYKPEAAPSGAPVKAHLNKFDPAPAEQSDPKRDEAQ